LTGREQPSRFISSPGFWTERTWKSSQ
jgi:hypothetical protein